MKMNSNMFIDEIYQATMLSWSLLEKKKSKSLVGCVIYKPTSFIKRLYVWQRHFVDIHDIIPHNPSSLHKVLWHAGTILEIRQWLETNCKYNYKLIIVPSDEEMDGYYHNKRNRIYFSNANDAMAFKLRWL